MNKGIAGSAGYGVGKVVIISDAKPEYENRTITDTDAEIKRYDDAVAAFTEKTHAMAEAMKESVGEHNAEILEGHILLLTDPGMDEITKGAIMSGTCAEAAFESTCDMFAGMFQMADDELTRQRATDIGDIKVRMLKILTGTPDMNISEVPAGTILVAEDLTPSMTAGIVKENVAGIITAVGGKTSHSAILARALEIPAVLSVKGILQKVKNGDSIIIDGAYGEVFINPTQRTFSIYEKKKKKYEEHIEELKTFINKSTETADGKKVMLAANIGGADEAAKAVKAGAEGVGLFRTEFLFLNKNALPTEEEQFEEYKKAAVLTKGMPLTIRTLDIGGDKDIPYMGLTKETNPFLGYRAIRFCLDRVDIFTTQLRAILRASAYGSIRIMIPMITSVNEVRQVKDMIKKICSDLDHNGISYDKNIQTGVMIETPAAAIMADSIAQEVDFFSIGTNDLTQYTIAVDRCNENVAYLYSAFNPAVLRLIRRIIECAHNAGIEAGMCGEAAANALMAPILLSFGLDEFSVSTGKVLETRKTIADWTLKEAGLVTDKVMSMATEKEVTDYLSDYLSERNKK